MGGEVNPSSMREARGRSCSWFLVEVSGLVAVEIQVVLVCLVIVTLSLCQVFRAAWASGSIGAGLGGHGVWGSVSVGSQGQGGNEASTPLWMTCAMGSGSVRLPSGLTLQLKADRQV